MGAIFLCGLMLFSERDRLDSTVWLWGAVLIAGLFVVSIPLAIWQKRIKERAHCKEFPPWPQPLTNPLFGKPLDSSDLHLVGTFIWTRGAFSRLAKDWARHTPAGKRYRRTMAALTSIGLAGLTLATIFLLQREWSAIALVVASAVLLLFAYDCRIRAPREVRSSARIGWELFPEGFVLGSDENQKVIEWDGVRAMVQTPAGFLFWPQDLIEVCLPALAFANQQDLDAFATLAQTKVRDFVRVD